MKYVNYVVFLWLFLILKPACAQNEWTNYQGNPAHTGFLDTPSNHKNMRELWRRKFQVLSDDTPINHYWNEIKGAVMSDDNAYITINHFYVKNGISPVSATITAYDLSSGAIRWQHSINSKYYPCRLSYPMVANDKIYVIENRGIQGLKLQSFESESGIMIKSLDLEGFAFDELDSNGPLSSDHDILAITSGKIQSIEATTEITSWILPISYLTMPAMSDSNITFPGDNGGLTVIDRHRGSVEYKIPTTISSGYYTILDYSVFNQNANMAYHTYHSHHKNHDSYSLIYAFDLNKRQIKWQWQSISINGSLVLAGNDLYVIGYDENKQLALLSLNALSGTINWKWISSELQGARTPVATNDHIFIPTPSKTIVISRKSHVKVWETRHTGELALGKNVLLILSREKGSTDKFGIPYITAISLGSE